MELEFYKTNDVVVRQQSTGEDLRRRFRVRCADVGLNCICVIFGSSEKRAVDNMVTHMFENHAINQEEMTACMKLKIRECMVTD